MEREFVPYELAVKLKALGFDEPCFGYYSKRELVYGSHTNNHMQRFRYSAPTFSQCFRWFREKYGYWSYVKEATKGTCRFYIEKFDEKFFNSDIIDSYQKAELYCLDRLIEIVETKSTQNINDGRTMEKLIESNRKFDEKNNDNVKYDSSDRNEDTPNITNFFI